MTGWLLFFWRVTLTPSIAKHKYGIDELSGIVGSNCLPVSPLLRATFEPEKDSNSMLTYNLIMGFPFEAVTQTRTVFRMLS